jgi:hypothetical protein
MTHTAQICLDGRRVPIRVTREDGPGASRWTACLRESPAVAFSGPDVNEAVADLVRFVRTREHYARHHGI